MKQGWEFLYSFRVTQFCFTHPILKSRLELQNISSLIWSQLCYIYWEHSTRACNIPGLSCISVHVPMYSIPFSDSDSMLINNHLLVCIMTNYWYSKWKLLKQIFLYTFTTSVYVYQKGGGGTLCSTPHFPYAPLTFKDKQRKIRWQNIKDAHKFASDQ